MKASAQVVVVGGGVVGALFDPDEGSVDPYGVTHAYAMCARNRGAEVYTDTWVTGLQPRADARIKNSRRLQDTDSLFYRVNGRAPALQHGAAGDECQPKTLVLLSSQRPRACPAMRENHRTWPMRRVFHSGLSDMRRSR